MWLRLMLVPVLSLVLSAEAGAYTAYVSNERSNTVSVIDTSKWEVIKTIKVGQRPRGIAHTKDQKYVLVAVGDDDTIQMIDTGTNQVVGTLPSGPDPELFVEAPDGKTLYVANEDDNTVTIIDTHTAPTEEVIHLGYGGSFYYENTNLSNAAWINKKSFWPTKPELIRMLHDAGYETVMEVAPSHAERRSFYLCCPKKQ